MSQKGADTYMLYPEFNIYVIQISIALPFCILFDFGS